MSKACCFESLRNYKSVSPIAVLISSCIDWKAIKCEADDMEPVPKGDGFVPNNRFRWLGVVQHRFYMAERMQFAITPGVLIHPGYVLAPAEDIGKIPHNLFANGTNFIVWGKGGEKYSLRVIDYILHPDYTSHVTSATVALVILEDWSSRSVQAPVGPMCLPLRGMGTFDNLYVIKLNDEKGEIRKQILKVDYVENTQCSEFYYRAHLTYEKMKPQYPLCAVVAPPVAGGDPPPLCLWDNGSLLVARLHDVYWTLLGFGVRGPGCGAPARFVGMHRMLEWVDTSIGRRPLEDLPADSTAFYLRQLAPLELQLFKADTHIPTDYGQCERGHKNQRGSAQYKDVIEILTNKNVATGFYFVEVSSIIMFTCATVKFETVMRSFTALWVEHDCHQDATGLAPEDRQPDRRKMECFVYFKTTAFVEFRFTFSFKGFVEMTLFGTPLQLLKMNPWVTIFSTDPWYPTAETVNYGSFIPYYWNKWI
ncbi:hypothetical protein O0L34_g4660 [Tuta absoluta]|nr:hypothetical protein O0L34_g4660 [Tuta absoluta]